jgi:hypothetical protein
LPNSEILQSKDVASVLISESKQFISMPSAFQRYTCWFFFLLTLKSGKDNKKETKNPQQASSTPFE